MMQEELYRKLINQLKSCDKDYYLKMDATVFQKMKEAICYVLKYKSLPRKNVVFSCEPVCAIEWIDKVKNYPEPLYAIFSAFIMQYKTNANGLAIWKFKYEDFRKYVLYSHKIPLA